ncbi:MAG: GGIII-like transmembrane region-containing protein, partial [Candidatus Heimdallarchaeota archaeon]
RFRAEILGAPDRSPHLYEIAIQYYVNEAPSEPTLTDPGDVSTSSSVAVSWSASTDDDAVDYYELQVDTEIGFATPINSYNVTDLTRIVTGLSNGTYYFRVRAVDTYDVASTWSNVVDIEVEIPALNLEWWHYVIVFGGLAAVILIIVIVVRVRKRKIPATR